MAETPREGTKLAVVDMPECAALRREFVMVEISNPRQTDFMGANGI